MIWLRWFRVQKLLSCSNGKSFPMQPYSSCVRILSSSSTTSRTILSNSKRKHASSWMITASSSFLVFEAVVMSCERCCRRREMKKRNVSNRHNPHAILTLVHPSSLPLVALPSVTTTVSSPLLLPLALTSIQSRLTTKSIFDHLASINKNIQDWIEKIKVKLSIPRLLLVDATDYRIEVAPAMDSAYIVCQCGVRSTLGKYKESFVVCPKLPQFEWRMRGSHAHSDSQSERREKLSDNLSWWEFSL